MQIIYRANNTSEAHIIAGMLRANDIAAHVGGHHLQGGMGLLAAIDFAHVYVDDGQVEDAKKIIAEYEKAGETMEAGRSEDTHIETQKRGRIFVLLFALLFVLGVVFNYLND